jgi:membrane associated rhomboid family serine protease
MFPISDEDSISRNAALVTWGLILLNVLAFLYELSLGSNLDAFLSNYGVVPREILTGQDVPPPGPTPLYLTLLTSMFLHGGWLHIIGNMAYLRVFGDDIEAAFGRLGYLVFYLFAGLVASLTQVVISGPADTTPSIGASGAIAGVLGAYIVLFPQHRIHVLALGYGIGTGTVSALVLLGFWFVLQFFNGITALSGGAAASGGVAVWAHVGGFIAGALIAWLLRGRVAGTTPLYRPRT